MRQEYILNKIGNNLRAERNRLGLSQEELAEKDRSTKRTYQ